MNKSELLSPNFNNCLLNIVASIQKHYRISSKFSTISQLDNFLLDSTKNIILMVLDGMGSHIVNQKLKKDSFLKSHKICDITSVFPPTTVAATTALLSGKAPIESGWIGWAQYFPNIAEPVQLFNNFLFYSKEYCTDCIVKQKYVSYLPFYHDFHSCHIEEIYPSFKEFGCQTFEEFTERILLTCQKNEMNFIYAYWDNPDYLMHDHGWRSTIVLQALNNIDMLLEQFAKKLPKNTTLIITADHGQIEVIPLNLQNYPQFLALLDKRPSLESRCTSFHVKKENNELFIQLFNQYFSKYFALYSREDFLNSGLLGVGINHENNNYSIGDFIAIGISSYYFQFKKEDDFIFKGHHAGLTREEMEIPLIVFQTGN